MAVDFSELDRRKDELREVSQYFSRAAGGKIFPLDFLAWAAANRTMGLIAAFRSLLETQNYASAAALLRLQIDTGLRFMASYHVKDPHEFAMLALKGEQINRQKDKTGKKLSDRRLVELALPDEPWIERVYEATSGFVHLSERHIFGAVDGIPADLTVGMRISETDSPNVTDAHRQEAVDAYVAAVGLLLRYLAGWGATKNYFDSGPTEA